MFRLSLMVIFNSWQSVHRENCQKSQMCDLLLLANQELGGRGIIVSNSDFSDVSSVGNQGPTCIKLYLCVFVNKLIIYSISKIFHCGDAGLGALTL